MASVDSTNNNPNDPNNPNNKPGAVSQPGQQTNQPATTGSGAGPVTATGSGNVTGQVVGTNNPSQPFQNISSYLAANAPQSQQLAGQVAQTVSNPINDAQTGITNAANTFTQSVNAGYTPENKDLTQAVSVNPSYVVAENADNTNNFLAQLHDTYAGPTDFTQGAGYQDLQGKIATAQAQAANTQNESGIQSLLGAVEGPTSAGNNKLDSLLLSADPTNYKTIQDAGAGAANLTPSLQQATTDQNAYAATGATNASTAAANAAKALQTALSGETGNLSDQQKTIEGIVNNYNKSVGIINPVTQTIAQDIQNFLSANPQLSLSDAASALGPLMNLNSINMPDVSTYASAQDYQTIQALQALGIDPSALSGLPINASQSNLAQTFQLPQQLQDAIGKAPGVEQALTDELNNLGGQISGAVQPFQDAQNTMDSITKTVQGILGPNTDPVLAQKVLQGGSVPSTLYDAQGNVVAPTISQMQGGIKTQVPNPAYAALKDQISQAAASYNQALSSERQQSSGLQWVTGASSGYNDLIAAINAELGKLGQVGVPTLNYAASQSSSPVTGQAIGVPTAQQLGKTADLGITAGIPAAAGIGAGVAASTIPTTAAALAAQGAGTVAGEVPAAGAGLTSGLGAASAVALPAAIAGYGASNVIQNSVKNPITSGLATLANTGLSLATLSLPPKIFDSIGGAIKDVFNSIGKFFGGLF